jgi:hypothetical protein
MSREQGSALHTGPPDAFVETISCVAGIRREVTVIRVSGGLSFTHVNVRFPRYLYERGQGGEHAFVR